MSSKPGHTCAAVGCRVIVPTSWLMCRIHWYSLPKEMRDRVWATYQDGQESEGGPTPTDEYFAIVKACITYLYPSA